jgi:hypothetical protein
MGGRMVARVEQNGNAIGGVAHVYPPTGKRLTYHFTGTVQGNKISAAHYSGHVFNGHVTPQGQIVGVLTTRNGEKISMTGRRR